MGFAGSLIFLGGAELNKTEEVSLGADSKSSMSTCKFFLLMKGTGLAHVQLTCALRPSALGVAVPLWCQDCLGKLGYLPPQIFCFHTFCR